MTIQEAKDQVAKKYGYHRTEDLYGNPVILDEAAELYAQSQVNDALDKANEAVQKYCEPSHIVIEELKKLKR